MKSLCAPILHLPHLRKALPFSVPLHAASFLSHPHTTSSASVVTMIVTRAQSGSQTQVGDEYEEEEEEEEEEASLVEDLRVPEHWTVPSKAKEESEWLRVTLHKWLDDEYCPEETNIEISKIAAQSFYNSLVEKDADIGTILLKMANDLQSINYQESFHGAFSSANAAVDLVMLRIEQASS